jgi:hypothetical protein
MVMPFDSNADDVRQQALLALTASFVSQGHPAEYAKHMATASIFQADLELRNAQMTNLLNWLKANHAEVHSEALSLLENVRQEFEQRVQQKS